MSHDYLPDVVRSLRVPAPDDRRVIIVPNDYRSDPALGWLVNGPAIVSDTGVLFTASEAEVWPLDDADVTTLRPPPP